MHMKFIVVMDNPNFREY